MAINGGKLDRVEILCILKLKLPKLKILHSDNLMKHIDEIDAIKDLKLEELKLAGNPICKKYEVRQNKYIEDMQKRFPDLLRLDGMDLTKLVMDEGNNLPVSERKFVASKRAQEFVRQFIQQYFLIFNKVRNHVNLC